MVYALVVIVVLLIMNLYVDFEISFTRSENGAFTFRFEVGMKKT